MKRTGEGVYQNNGINQIIEFIRENALAQVIGNQPVITSKGEVSAGAESDGNTVDFGLVGCVLR
jgi:hypothetical protein